MNIMIQPIAEFVTDLFGSWIAVGRVISDVIEGFVQFASEPISESIDQYGPDDPSTTPTTQFLSGIYAVAKRIPTFLFFYFLLRPRWGRRRALLSALIVQVLVLLVFAVWWGVRPGPIETYETFAFGPSQLLTTIENHITADLVGAFTTWVVVLGTFILLSYSLWYVLNLSLWVATLMVKQTPMFSDSSAKGHAAWMTLTWVFFLTMETGTIAFINTLIVFVIILLRRSWDPTSSKTKSKPDRPRRRIEWE